MEVSPKISEKLGLGSAAARVRAWAQRQPRIVGAAPTASAGRSLLALLPVAQGIAKEFLCLKGNGDAEILDIDTDIYIICIYV